MRDWHWGNGDGRRRGLDGERPRGERGSWRAESILIEAHYDIHIEDEPSKWKTSILSRLV